MTMAADNNAIRYCFSIACGLGLVGAVAHEALGTPMVLVPLEASELEPVIVGLLSFIWHVGTVATLAMTGLFWVAARDVGAIIVARVATTMAMGMAGIGLWLTLGSYPALWTTPAPYLWTLVSCAAVSGCWLQKQEVQ